MRGSMIKKACAGCSHPTICKVMGCAAVEFRANSAKTSSNPLTEDDVRRIVREELAKQDLLESNIMTSNKA